MRSAVRFTGEMDSGSAAIHCDACTPSARIQGGISSDDAAWSDFAGVSSSSSTVYKS